MLISMVATPTLAAPASNGSTSTDNVDCARSIGRAITTGSAADVPANCWRIGSLQLGMSEAEVAHQIGTPFVETETEANKPNSQRHFHAAIYAVPHGPITPFSQDKTWFLELRFETGRLVAIDTSVDMRTEFSRCSPSLQKHVTSPIVSGTPSGPLSRFGQIAIGNRLSTLRHVFGRLPDGNRSRDWFNYWPIPISVDAYGQIITAIAIATDKEAMMARPPLLVVERRDPATCRPISVSYSLNPYRTAPRAAR